MLLYITMWMKFVNILDLSPWVQRRVSTKIISSSRLCASARTYLLMGKLESKTAPKNSRNCDNIRAHAFKRNLATVHARPRIGKLHPGSIPIRSLRVGVIARSVLSATWQSSFMSAQNHVIRRSVLSAISCPHLGTWQSALASALKSCYQ